MSQVAPSHAIPPLFPAFPADKQDTAYKMYMRLRARMKQEGTLTEEDDERLLRKAEDVKRRLREYQASYPAPSSK